MVIVWMNMWNSVEWILMWENVLSREHYIVAGIGKLKRACEMLPSQAYTLNRFFFGSCLGYSTVLGLALLVDSDA